MAMCIKTTERGIETFQFEMLDNGKVKIGDEILSIDEASVLIKQFAANDPNAFMVDCVKV